MKGGELGGDAGLAENLMQGIREPEPGSWASDSVMNHGLNGEALADNQDWT